MEQVKFEGAIDLNLVNRTTGVLQIMMLGLAHTSADPTALPIPVHPAAMLMTVAVAYGRLLAANGVAMPQNGEAVFNCIQQGYERELEAQGKASLIQVSRVMPGPPPGFTGRVP